MGKPKKRTSPRKTGLRQSHQVVELARKVNAKLSNIGSSVKAYTTKRESAKTASADKKAEAPKKATAKAAAKPASK